MTVTTYYMAASIYRQPGCDLLCLWVLVLCARLRSGVQLAPQVYLKYKCGNAPEVTHFYVLLYLDRLLARPVEIWQVR